MSKYTTGEVAKLCGITVRTVQYYDSRGILKPSQFSEGGRRLYSDHDVQRMQLVCMLRNLGLSLDTIRKIQKEPNSASVISALLEEQSRKLQAEIAEYQIQNDAIQTLLKGLRSLPSFSMESIYDIAYSMENRKKLHRTYRIMLVVGILMDIIEIGTLVLWITTGIWLPFAIGIPLVALCGIGLTRTYYRNSAYLCPDCHTKFKPRMRDFLFSAHTPRTRKLTCPHCGHHTFCIETYDDGHASRLQ